MNSSTIKTLFLLILSLAFSLPANAQEADPTDLCSRTAVVKNVIVSKVSGKTNCADITVAELAGVTGLSFVGGSLNGSSLRGSNLKSGDFAGLTGLTDLRLRFNEITTLPADIFSGLSALTRLELDNNQLSTLPTGVFSGLISLTNLNLSNNPLPASLPASLFADVPSTATIILPTGTTINAAAPTTVGSIPAQTTNLGIPLTVNVADKFSDPNDTLTYTVKSNNTATATVAVSGSTVTITPVAIGTADITVTATDTAGQTAIQTFMVTVISSPLPNPLVCMRHPKVKEVIIQNVHGKSACGDITAADLAGINSLVHTGGFDFVPPKRSDFAGLTTLLNLDISGNNNFGGLTTLPADLFQGLPALRNLSLTNNQLSTLPIGIFEGLSLIGLTLGGNPWVSLPTNIFNEMASVSQTTRMSVMSLAPINAALPATNGTIPAQSLARTANPLTLEVATFFSDPGDTLTYTATSATPAIASVAISGSTLTITPVALGTTNIMVTARDTAGQPVTQTFALTVSGDAAAVAAPNISPSVPALIATQAVAITPITIDATAGGAVDSYSISPDLPAGLSFNTGSGEISGAPTAVAGEQTYTITATNTAGSHSLSVTITVNAVPIIAADPHTLIATVGTAITPTSITNTGGPVTSYAISRGNGQSLNANTGLVFDTITGSISGTPTMAADRLFYTISATNAPNFAHSASIDITIVAAPDISPSVPTLIATVGTAIPPIIITNNGGAVARASYSISPNLPAGLSIDTSTGEISGMPTAVASAQTYTITANGVGIPTVTATATVDITVNAADNTAPDAPVITQPTTPTNNDSITISGSAEADATVTLSQNGTALATTATAGSNGTWSIEVTLSADNNGANTFTATATDQASNASGSSNEVTVTLDQTKPAIIIRSTSSTNPTNDNPIGITLKFTEPLTGFDESDIAVTNGTITAGSYQVVSTVANGVAVNVTFTITPSADGIVALRIVANAATDAAGNGNIDRGSVFITYDGTAPDVAITSTAQTVNTAAFTLTGTTEAGATVDVLKDGTSIGAATVTAATWTFDVMLTEGANLFTVTASDAAGNVSEVSAAVSITRDSTAAPSDTTRPSVAISSFPVTANIVNGDTVNATTLRYEALFDESVSGFEIGDIMVTGTAGVTMASGLTGAGRFRQFEVLRGNLDGTVIVSIAAGAAQDAADNFNTASDEYTLTIDTTPPVITRNGDAALTIVSGTTYTDAGATASDNIAGNITASITTTITFAGNTVAAVNTNTAGVYSIAYNVSDAASNPAPAVTRTVTVMPAVAVTDTTPPTITLLGSATLSIAFGTVYTDTGATASDDTDGNITASITTTITFAGNTVAAVNPNTAGVYTIAYNVSDTAGNPATPVTRTVTVMPTVTDTTPPTITLLGNATLSIAFGTAYTDAGATASDNTDGNITTSITTTITFAGNTVGAVNPNTAGVYTIAYNVSDTAGNQATPVTRTVTVMAAATVTDTTPPTITLLGNATLSIALNTAYTDAGATASDNTDGNITASITTTITFAGNTVGAVNPNTAGVYTIAYNVSDMAGNQATPVTRTVTVVPAATVTDTTPPTITLLGNATLSIAFGTVYTDAGATASDNIDGNITASITTTITFAGNTVGAVNPNTAGVYTIAYNVSDTAGNQATPVTRTVTVMAAATVTDTTPPTITLLGNATLSIALNTAYTDAGATASDNTDGNITASITTTITFAGNTVGAVNPNTAGVYTIAYNVSDMAGNQATPVTRTVTVVPAATVTDTTPPTITLLGNATLSIAFGTVYTDAGATASDNTDGNITTSITTTITFAGNTVAAVNPNTAGVYSIAYNVSDTAGNQATPVTRTVTVMPAATVTDTTPPTITLLGNATLSIAFGTVYTDAGATASDNTDGNITTSITTTITFAGNTVGAVNPNTAGVYTIAYNVSDTAGNPATPVTRTVTVMPAATVTDTTPPTITLLGSATLSIALNTAYTDAGATASDNTDGNITASITTTITFNGNTVAAVNTNTAGVYSIAYNVSDTAGNPATPVTRTVTVMPAVTVTDTTPPTITLLGSATLSIALNTAYTDAGATASDNTDGNITASITTTITFAGNTVAAVNPNTAGVYSIAYNVSDTAGNQATPVTRTVTVMAAVAVTDTTPTATVNESVQVTSKTIDVGGKTITVESRTIQVEVATGVGEATTITRFSAREALKAVLETIANKAVAMGGIDVRMESSIDSTITPTLVLNTAVDITVNKGACPAKGCEVTLSYEASDEQAGKDLYVFHYDEMADTWEALPHVRRDRTELTVTALADSFSPFALFNASGADKLAKQLQADNKQLNKDILPNLVQTMLASTMSAVSTRIDATFSGTPQGSYQLDGQTVKLNGSGNLQDAMTNKLPHYATSLKDGTMDWKAMLSRSSFVLPLNAVGGDGAAGATVWGSGNYNKMGGKLSDGDWKGDVFSLQLGVDQRVQDDLLAGGLVSWSKGDVDYTQDNKSGDYTHQITSVHPYMAWSIDDARLWSSVGYGQGELSIKEQAKNREGRSDTRLLSLSAGVSGRLSQFGQSNLNLKSDMVLAQIDIAGSSNKEILTDSLANQRLRLLLEIDRELQLASGGRFNPLMEIGLRYDGGAGKSGLGAVLGFGGRYANTGLTVEGKFHTLVGRKDYKEWGVQGTIRKTSANDQGLTFSLIPSYGATGNRANQVWKQKLSDGNKSNGDYQVRLDVNVGYGLFTGGGLLTPYSELRMGKNNRYRLGLRWKPNSPFSLHLYGEHTTSNDSDRILLETNIRF